MPTPTTSLHPAAPRSWRAVVTYILPAVAVFWVVLSGLWLVPDSFQGMYGNHDGQWASWYTRGILEWSEFLDFSPFSPLTGTGSPFLPNLPWLNPGALALAIPAPLPLRHLVSMLIYLTELAGSLYLLYRHLEFSREHAFLATLLYVCMFFIPLAAFTLALPWYALAPMNAHLIASMNLATIALLRAGHGQPRRRFLFGLVFVTAVFVAFASAPVTSMTYVPVYGLLWMAFLAPFRTQKNSIPWRWGTIATALLVLGLTGVPAYLAATIMTSVRGTFALPFFHPGWLLLSPSYWCALASNLQLCWNHWQLMCPSSIIGWYEIAALGGGAVLLLTGRGAKRRYGLAVIALLAALHFYAVLSQGWVLGRLHVVSPPFLMWAFFPLAAPAAIAVGGFAGRLLVRRQTPSTWAPAAAGWLIAGVAVFVWLRVVLPNQPRLAGHGPLGLAPIAHVPVNQGPVVEYLREHIGLQPGSELRGYVSTFLGAPDGLVRKLTATPADVMTWDAYIASRDILFDHFGNSFQKMDLWNSDIPTFEENGQSVSKQMHYFNRDLLSEPRDWLDPLPASILLYRFRPEVLRALGVRFVIADGTLAAPGVELVMSEAGKDAARINLYEIKGANLGQFSPTQVTWVDNYAAAVSALRESDDLENRVVLLGPLERHSELVRASRSRLKAVRDGYQLTASAPGTSMVLLPIQFSHCWKIETKNHTDAPRLVRANIVQTGIVFKDNVDVRLRFDFEPWKASCRRADANDLAIFGFK